MPTTPTISILPSIYSGGYSSGYGNLKDNYGEPLQRLFEGDRILGFSGSDMERRYTNYLQGQEFYKFAKNVRESLEADPSYIEELREKITSVRDLILRRDNLIVMNTASQDNLDKMEKVSEEILGALPSLENGAETYDFPEPEKNQAVIVESSSQYTVARCV